MWEALKAKKQLNYSISEFDNETPGNKNQLNPEESPFPGGSQHEAKKEEIPARHSVESWADISELHSFDKTADEESLSKENNNFTTSISIIQGGSIGSTAPAIANRSSSISTKQSGLHKKNQSMSDFSPLMKSRQMSISTSKQEKVPSEQEKANAGNNLSQFVRKKLKQIEDLKNDPSEKRVLTQKYFDLFEEMIAREPSNMLFHMWKEMKYAMQKHFIDIQLEVCKSHNKEVELLKNEITKVTLEKQREIRSALYIHESNKDLLQEIEKHKKRIEEIALEVKEQENIKMEWQKLHTEKFKRVKELENQNLYLLNINEPYKNAIAKYKIRDRKALYLLSLLHFKGYPVTEVYENEVRRLSTAKLKAYTSNFSNGLNQENEEDTLESLSLTQEFNLNFLANSNTKLRNIKSRESSNIKRIYNELFMDEDDSVAGTRRSRSIETKHYPSADENEIFDHTGTFNKTYPKKRSSSYFDTNNLSIIRRAGSPTSRISSSSLLRFERACSACDLKVKRAATFDISRQNS